MLYKTVEIKKLSDMYIIIFFFMQLPLILLFLQYNYFVIILYTTYIYIHLRSFCCGFIEINVWEAKFLLSETLKGHPN